MFVTWSLLVTTYILPHGLKLLLTLNILRSRQPVEAKSIGEGVAVRLVIIRYFGSSLKNYCIQCLIFKEKSSIYRRVISIVWYFKRSPVFIEELFQWLDCWDSGTKSFHKYPPKMRRLRNWMLACGPCGPHMTAINEWWRRWWNRLYVFHWTSQQSREVFIWPSCVGSYGPTCQYSVP